jgi:hypothetical protein
LQHILQLVILRFEKYSFTACNVEEVKMATLTKAEASQIAKAAAQGVAIALSHRPQGSKEEFFIPPHVVCGIPPYIFQAVLKADAQGTVGVGPITETKAG